MRSAFLFYLQATAGAAGALQGRQFGGLLGGLGGGSRGGGGMFGGGQTYKTFSVEKLEPEISKSAIRQLTKFGPINIKGKRPGQTDSGQQSFMFTIHDGLCQDCTVLKGKAGIVDASSGTPSDATAADDGVYIHHILTFDSSKQTQPFISSCDTQDKTRPPATSGGLGALTGGLGAKFIGTGDDQANIYVYYTTPAGPAGYTGDGEPKEGFWVRRGDRFTQNVDVVNYGARDRDVYITMEIEYLPGLVGVNTRDSMMSVTGCGGRRIDTGKSGEAVTRSGYFRFLDSGVIVYARGHLHGGGVKMVLKINDKVVCESVAEYGGSVGGGTDLDTIEKMGICTDRIPVKKGDWLSIESVYDQTKHPVRHDHSGMTMGGGDEDVMGLWALSFAGGETA